MARTHADPALPTSVADAGSRRPRLVLVLVVGVLLAAAVRSLLLESYVVASPALAPTLVPGDRVLVWKALEAPAAGDLVVVDTTGSGVVHRAAPQADGLLGRALGAVADSLGVRSGATDTVAVVGSVDGDRVRISAPRAEVVASSDVIGVVGARFWPLGRLGTVTEVGR